MACINATDADLILAWPGVVLRTGERWLVVVDADLAQTGAYTVEIQGLPFAYSATVPPDDATAIRGGLKTALSGQLFAAVMASGEAGLVLREIVPPAPQVPPGLDVDVTGPAADTIEATLVSGGDGNAAARAYWLDAVLCSLPACCAVTCPADYTRMHAALAAHWIYLTMPANVGSTGSGANDFQSMRLGPASLSRGASAWGAGGAATDADLAQTVPGRYFLSLRRKYVFPVMCA